MTDRLESLRLLVAVAEKGSFAEAARTLRVSPATATRAVAALEDRLGARLFHRTTRSVRLTPEGADYVERTRSALETLEEADRHLDGRRVEPRGMLVLTAPVVFGRMHVAPVVAGLLRAHSALTARLMLTDRFVRVVEEGIDIAVRIGQLSDSALRASKIAQVHRILVASLAYLRARGVPREVKDLRAHALIAFDSLALNDEWLFGGARPMSVRIEPRLMTDDIPTAIDAALDGFGIARVLSYQVARQLKDGRLVRLMKGFEQPPLPVNLLFQANRQGSPNVRAFIDAARQYFARRDID